MSSFTLRRRHWYYDQLGDEDSDDSERYANEDEYSTINLPVEQLFTGDYATVQGLETRTINEGLYKRIKHTGSKHLMKTYRNLTRSTILLKRQLRRVTRHLESLEDHVMYRNALCVTEYDPGNFKSRVGDDHSGHNVPDGGGNGTPANSPVLHIVDVENEACATTH